MHFKTLCTQDGTTDGCVLWLKDSPRPSCLLELFEGFKWQASFKGGRDFGLDVFVFVFSWECLYY